MCDVFITQRTLAHSPLKKASEIILDIYKAAETEDEDFFADSSSIHIALFRTLDIRREGQKEGKYSVD